MSAAVPMTHTANYPQGHMETHTHDEPDWMRIGMGVTLIAGSILLLTRQRRLGLLVTAAGTALAALEHKEEISEWWDALPAYLDKAEKMINQTQETIENLTDKRDKIMSLFGK